MFIIQITAFLVLIMAIGWKFRIHLVEAVPIGCGILILMLYLLAFFRRLSFSDGIALLWLGGAVVCVARLSGEKRKLLLDFVRQELLGASTLTALFLIVSVCICVSAKVVSWWDDYNFWATDVKSLFYLDGFAGKYANAAPEFGDYPPGTQLMKWWFLHFSPAEFREGLMFAGYYFMNLAFLCPLLKVIRKRNVFAMAAGAAVLWFFPAVAEAFWCDGCCADLTMAVVYGAFLVSVADKKNHERLFYYGRQALFLMILVLCKNTGVIWAAFGILFDVGYHFLVLRREKNGDEQKSGTAVGKQPLSWRCLLGVILAPVLAEGSWLGFCLFNRRVAKLTGTAIQMATGAMHIPVYQEEMVRAFMEAFLKWPLHRYKTPAVDLSPLGLYLLILLIVFLLWHFRLLERRRAIYLGAFFAVTGVIFYSFNLISHLTIFSVETQYLEPFGMVSSIERYGAPFTIGGLYLLAFLIMNGQKTVRGAFLCVAFVLLTTDHASACRALAGYRGTVDEVLDQRREIVDEAAERFLDAVGAGEHGRMGRVLYLRDSSDVSWVRNTYIGFEAAPVSVMYGNIDTEATESAEIVRAIEDTHAGYLYVDRLEGPGEELFIPFLDVSEVQKGAVFEYECLYRVDETADGIRLVKTEKAGLSESRRKLEQICNKA